MGFILSQAGLTFQELDWPYFLNSIPSFIFIVQFDLLFPELPYMADK
jgi:hypothetical protein